MTEERFIIKPRSVQSSVSM